MSHTTDKMREVAGTIARLITEQGKAIGVDECYVDDFGRFGNFQLVCGLDVSMGSGTKSGYRPNNSRTFSLFKIAFLIKRIVGEHKEAKLRSHESPQGVYSSNSCGGMRFKPSFEGYDKNYVMIDIDFIPYHAESNTFAVQSEMNFDRQPRPDDNQLSLFK